MDSIIKIKQVINSLESGIGDEDAKALVSLLSGLEGTDLYQGNTVTLVKMMQSTGRYLASRTHTAHPDTVPLLVSLADDLDSMINEPARPKAEVQEILGRNLRSFKALKVKIEASSPLSAAELEELKAVILSVDWEISDVTLKSFDQVITRFKEKLKSNKLHYTFLRIIHSIGGYIARNKAGSDMNSIKLLQSVYLNYEKLIQRPDMAFEEKKQMIESDIRAYNEFKQGIARWTQTDPQGTLEDDDLPPALSHVNFAPATRGAATLSTLAESPEEVGEILPALAGRNKSTQPRDVMDDLFSPKTSPADELLDEIHLAELHGPAPQSPMGMGENFQKEAENLGVKNLSPQRGGQAPIPEIESRLDEFFNLDVSENSLTELPEVDTDEVDTPPRVFSEEIETESQFVPDELEPELEPEPEFEPEFEPEPDLAMEMVPDDGIELIESAPPLYEQDEQDHSLLVEDLKDDPAESVLGRLKTLLNAPSELAGESIFTQARQDLAQLEQLWKTQTDKTVLIELLTGLTRYIHELAVDPENEPVENALEEDMLKIEKAPKGFWGKIKSKFRK